MQAAGILTSVAILLIAAAVWDDLRRSNRVTPARRTYLLVASLFAAIGAVLHLVP